MVNFIFDVDGTLTPSRGRIDPKFHDFFLRFCETFNVYLVTGSDYEKTREQLGDEILKHITISFNCAGNSNWARGIEVYRNDFVVEEKLITFLKEKLLQSKFAPKTSNHIEYRNGMINFSVVGRGCTLEQRYLYKQWDDHKQERMNIASELMEKFPGIVAQVAGETGIDIYENGRDKGQVAEWVRTPIIFYGDKMEPGGNDHPLAIRLNNMPHCKAVPVRNWNETYSCLQAMLNEV